MAGSGGGPRGTALLRSGGRLDGSGPAGEVPDVGPDVRGCPRVGGHAGSLGLRHERGGAAAGVPVVIGEVVEARMGDGAAGRAAAVRGASLERDDEVEGAARRRA